MSAQRKYYEYEDDYYEEQVQAPASRDEEIKSLKVRSKEPLFKTVVDTATRSHCQVLFLVAAVMALLVVVGSGVSASRGYALVATQNQATQLEQENERLRIENAKLKAPQRIKDIAEGELGMTVPKKIYFAHEN